MLNQIVLDMQNQLVEAKKQVAVSIADEKRLKKQLDEQGELSKEWERKAMMAVRAGDDTLAKEALRRKQEHDGQVAEFAKQWDLQKQAVDKLKEQLRTPERQDRGGQAQEEHPHRPAEAGRGPAGHPGHHARAVATPAPSTPSIAWPSGWTRSRPRPRPRPSWAAS